MTLKFDCPCGLRIGFDVEPENGRMPATLNCPSCNSDITALADAEIAAQLAATPAAAPAKPAMRIARHAAPATSAGQPEPGPAPATAHPPPEAAAEPAIKAPAAPFKPAKPEFRPPGFLALHGFKLAGLAIVAVLGFWIWFSFVGSKPRILFSLETTDATPFVHARLLDPERVLILTPQRLSVRNTVTDTDVWSAEIKVPEAVKNPEKPKEGARFSSEFMDTLTYRLAQEFYDLKLLGKSAWVRVDTKVYQYDIANGKRLSEIPIPQPVNSDRADAGGWLFISEGTNNQRVLTRVDFASGKATTARFTPPGAQRAAMRFSEEPSEGPYVASSILEFRGTAVLQAKLLEANVSSKKPDTSSKPSLIEKENLRAGDSDAVGAEFVRNNQDYASEDLSKYEVTIRRPFGGTAWKGEVAGRPILVPLATLDLLIAGKSAIAFDRSGTKLWQAAMGNTVSDRHLSGYDDEGRLAPAFETGGRIYVIDRGTVHALNSRNGEAAWRLPTVGATEIVHTPSAVYMVTTSAGPEAVNLANPRDGRDVQPLLLSVAPADGRVRWQAAWVADHVMVSGKFVFGWRAGTSRLEELSAAMNQTEAPTMLHLNKLDPSNGKTDWHWSKKGGPDTVAAAGNRILVHKPREILVLGFRSL